METELFIEPIPTWALPYLINGDATGLQDDDLRMIKDWQEQTRLEVTADYDSEEYFTGYPAFGKACMVIDCKCYPSFRLQATASDVLQECEAKIATTFCRDDLKSADRQVLEDLIVWLYDHIGDCLSRDVAPWDRDEQAEQAERARMFAL